MISVGADEATERALDSNPTSYRHFIRHLVAGAAASGRDMTVTKDYKQWVIEAGFVDVVEDLLYIP